VLLEDAEIAPEVIRELLGEGYGHTTTVDNMLTVV
jgi:hypothetical protein